MTRESISILGCGWLGRPLACKLQISGYAVRGSATSSSKAETLRGQKIEACVIRCDPEVAGESLADFFAAPILVITLPFRRGLVDPGVYRCQVASALDRWQPPDGEGRVLFTSSTSVYPADAGRVLEAMPFTPDTPRSGVLRLVEDDVLNCGKARGTVVRLAGLYGGERRIGGFLAGKTHMPNPELPVNLIHQDDAVGILFEIIRQGAWGEIFNAAADGHPARRDVYTAAARAQGLPIPEFAPQNPAAAGKIVVNDKVKSRLGYRFQHPEPMEDIG